MAHTTSSRKRARQNDAHRLYNKVHLKKVRAAKKELDVFIELANLIDCEARYRDLQSKVDKAAKSGVIPPNKARRIKSRYNKRLAQLLAGRSTAVDKYSESGPMSTPSKPNDIGSASKGNLEYLSEFVQADKLVRDKGAAEMSITDGEKLGWMPRVRVECSARLSGEEITASTRVLPFTNSGIDYWNKHMGKHSAVPCSMHLFIHDYAVFQKVNIHTSGKLEFRREPQTNHVCEVILYFNMTNNETCQAELESQFLLDEQQDFLENETASQDLNIGDVQILDPRGQIVGKQKLILSAINRADALHL
jgi:ribosomal protein S20